MSDEQRLGTAVQEVMESASLATNFGKRVGHGFAARLPENSPEVHHEAVQHLLHAVAALQTVVQLLADELDRRDAAVYQ